MVDNIDITSDKSNVWRELATALIGLKIRIMQSSSIELEGRSGIIVDETHNTLKIESDSKVISVQKEFHIFEIETRNKGKILVEGHLLKGLPGQRVKRKFPTW